MGVLEEMMGLFGDSANARGMQGLGGAAVADDRDPRRRRAGMDSGFGGVAGGEVTLASILPHLQGLRSYDYSGPNIRGLADLIPGMAGLAGPSLRHLQGQGGGFDLPPGLADMPELPPGVDTRLSVGGPNVAPGNLDAGLALGQAPGLPAQAMGQVPHTQGWRNVAPGYGAAAQLGYGTPEFAQLLQGGRGGIAGVQQGGPGAQGGVEGQGGGARGGGGGPTPVQAGGPAEAVPTAGGGRGRQPGAPAAGGGGGGGRDRGAPGGKGRRTGTRSVKNAGTPATFSAQDNLGGQPNVPGGKSRESGAAATKGGKATPEPKDTSGANTAKTSGGKTAPAPQAGPGKTKPKKSGGQSTLGGVMK